MFHFLSLFWFMSFTFISSLKSYCWTIYFTLISLIWCVYALQPLNSFSSILSHTTLNSEMSFWLIFLSLFLLSSLLHTSSGKLMSISLSLILLLCVIFFSTSSFLVLYVSYEASLLPISYIILKWGSYKGRSLSVFYMILYTTLFTFPMILCLFYMNLNYYSFFLINNPLFKDTWVILLLLMSFMVKLPIYGLHYWLPQAHVEAPTVGSMILAGVLLKLGGYGLWRSLSLVILTPNQMHFFMCFCLLGMVLSSIYTCMQLDFKRLVAYSSVVHMTVLAPLLMYSSISSSHFALMLMMLHGILSPLMFFLVSVVYLNANTRLLLVMKSIHWAPYLVILIFTLSFLMNVPTPPFPQFFLEVGLFTMLYSNSNLMIYVIILYTFMGLLYNLIWFTPSSIKLNTSSQVSSMMLSLFDIFLMLLYLLMLFLLSLFFMM